jgi:hypothetical protein
MVDVAKKKSAQRGVRSGYKKFKPGQPSARACICYEVAMLHGFATISAKVHSYILVDHVCVLTCKPFSTLPLHRTKNYSRNGSRRMYGGKFDSRNSLRLIVFGSVTTAAGARVSSLFLVLHMLCKTKSKARPCIVVHLLGGVSIQCLLISEVVRGLLISSHNGPTIVE